MTVAYILHTTSPTDGSNKSFLVMLKGLMQKGVKPVVVVPNREGVCKELEKMGIPIFQTSFRMYTYPLRKTLSQKLQFPAKLLARLIMNWTATKGTICFLRKHAVSLVHTNVGPINIGFRAAQKLGVPHIFHLREYGKLDFGLDYFPSTDSFYKQLDETPKSYSICITRAISRYHHQDRKVSSRVIYNGICPAKKEMPMPEGKLDYLLYAGRIEQAKGVDALLETYFLYTKQTPEPLPLRIVGFVLDRSYGEKLERFIEEHGLQNLVTFLGQRNDVANLMRDARAIIIPSPHEAFGRCMPEAMMQGCLAIGHNTDGTKEQFDNGLELTGEEIGLRYDSVQELAQLLNDVTLNPASHYQPYRERAFRTVNQLYTQETNVQQIYAFYKEIIK